MGTEIKNEGAFLKALIKINYPNLTQEEIELEYQKQIKEIKENPDDCEMCSG